MQTALIDAIVAEPNSPGPWLIYADWLLEHGDPRGELINLEIAIDDGLADPSAIERRDRLRAGEDALLSPRLLAQAHHWNFEQRRGFILAANLLEAPSSFATANQVANEETIAALFADPHVRLLEVLALCRVAADRFSRIPLVQNQRRPIAFGPSLVAAALAEPRPLLHTLRTFDLGDSASELNANAPALTTLELGLAGPGDVRELIHDRLRELSSYSAACPAVPDGAAHLPRLETLTWFVVDSDSLLRRGSLLFAPPKQLHSLHLYAFDPQAHLPGDLVGLLANSPSARQLRTLALRPVHLGDLVALCERRTEFPSLEVLQLVFVHDGVERQPVAVVRDLFERAFVGVAHDLGWNAIERRVANLPLEFDPAPERANRVLVDANSRRLDDGRIDAFAGFGQVGRPPRRPDEPGDKRGHGVRIGVVASIA